MSHTINLMLDELLETSDSSDAEFQFLDENLETVGECINLLTSDSSSSDDECINYVIDMSKRSTFPVRNLEISTSSDDSEEKYSSLKRKRPKIINYIQTVHKYNDEEFQQTFRVKRDVAYYCVELYEKSPWYTNALYDNHKKYTAEVEFLCFLWFAANKCCLRDVSERFGVSIATAFRQHENVMKFIISIAPKIICFPENLEEVVNKFERIAAFPNVIGCIDGMYVPIQTPRCSNKESYTNRHHATSITLQAVCDADMKFLDVSTGTSGRMHDARAYRFSDLATELPIMCNGHYHILGDGAYPLREYLLTPYRNYGALTPQQRNFNERFSATRVKIENSFALLQSRFRQLRYGIDMHYVHKISEFIISCCVLHNLCLYANDNINNILINNNNNNNNDNVPEIEEENNVIEINLRRRGEEKRDELSRVLYNL